MLQLVAIAVPEETSRSTLSPRSICNASELGEVGEGGAASTKESSSAPNKAVSNMCHSITTKSHHLSINIDQHPWTQQYFPWNDAFTHQWTRANLRNVGKPPDLVIPFIIVFLQFWRKPLHQYKTNKSAKRWSWHILTEISKRPAPSLAICPAQSARQRLQNTSTMSGEGTRRRATTAKPLGTKRNVKM